MGNQPTAKKPKTRLLFESTPEKSTQRQGEPDSNSKPAEDGLKPGSSKTSTGEKSRLFHSERIPENNLSSFRDSFKRAKKPNNDEERVEEEMEECVDFVRRFLDFQDLHSVKMPMTSNSLLAFNVESLETDKAKKEVKLISFEDILINGSLKQLAPGFQAGPSYIKDQIDLETEALFVLPFSDAPSPNSLPLRIQRLTESRPKASKSPIIALFTQEQDARNSVKTSQSSDSVSEKMREDLKKHHFETASSRMSEPGFEPLHQSEAQTKENKPTEVDVKPGAVISLVKFKKEGSKRDVLSEKSNQNKLESSGHQILQLSEPGAEKTMSQDTSKFNIFPLKDISEEKPVPSFPVVSQPEKKGENVGSSQKLSKKASKESLKAMNQNEPRTARANYECSCNLERILEQKLGGKDEKTEAGSKLNKFFKEEKGLALKEDIEQIIDQANKSLRNSIRNSQNNSFRQSNIIKNLNDSQENSKMENDSPGKSDAKNTHQRILEMVFQDKLLEHQRKDNYLLSPKRAKKSASRSTTPKARQLTVKGHYLNTEENSYSRIMSVMKETIHVSYNRLLDVSYLSGNERPRDGKAVNKTTEIMKKSNLKNSDNLKKSSILSTPMILIQKPEKKPQQTPAPQTKKPKIDEKAKAKFNGKSSPKKKEARKYKPPSKPSKASESANMQSNPKLDISLITNESIPFYVKNDLRRPKAQESNELRISLKPPERVSLKSQDRVSFKTLKEVPESKKSIRISTTRKEGGFEPAEEPTPKMSIRTRASSENNPEKMIRNVRSDIEKLKDKIKGRLADGILFHRANFYH